MRRMTAKSRSSGLGEKARKVPKEREDYVAKLKGTEPQGFDLREVTMGDLRSEEQLSSIAARFFTRRGMTEDTVRERLEKIAGIFGSVHEVDADQLARDVLAATWA